MADNIQLDAGSGGSTIKTDDDGTAHWQYVKLAYGADNTQTRVTASVGLPVTILAGSAAIGKLAANSGVDIGDVDVTSLIPGTGATNLGKAEDAVHGSGDTGVMALAVRNDTLAALAGSDGDYAPLQVDADGYLYTKITNNCLVSTNNSTSSVLAGDAVFTGTGEDISKYASISIQIKASHASATDGLSVEFSTDNSNWDEKHTATIAATTSREFVFPAHAQYFRVVYTNGSTLQTYFRLQTIFHVQNIPSISHALDAEMEADSVANLTKSVIIAQQAGTGNFVPVQSTGSGNLKVSIEEAVTSAGGMAKAEDAAHTTGDVGVMALAVRRAADTPTSGTDGDYEPLKTDANGHLKVEIFDGGDSHTIDGTVTANAGTGSFNNDSVAAEAGAVTNGVLIQGDDGTDRKNINVDATTGDVQVDVTNTVTVDLGANNDVTLNANSGVDIGDVDILSIAAGDNNIGNVDIASALPAGTNAIGKLAANSGVDIGDVDVTSISAGSNLIGDVGLSGARTSGGTTLYKNIDVDESEDQIKATAGQVYWIHAMNLANATRFLKFYNATAANVTVGTTTPDLTFPLPTQGDTNGAGFTLSIPNGIAFGTAITVAATTGIADNNSGAPGANEVVVNLGYA